MYPTSSQFGGTSFGGGYGLGSTVGASGNEAAPVNNIVEKSGQAGRPAPSTTAMKPLQPMKPLKPMKPLLPKAAPTPVSSGGSSGRAAMSPTSTNFGL